MFTKPTGSKNAAHYSADNWGDTTVLVKLPDGRTAAKAEQRVSKWKKPLDKLTDDDWKKLMDHAMRYIKTKGNVDIPDVGPDPASSSAPEEFDLESDVWSSSDEGDIHAGGAIA